MGELAIQVSDLSKRYRIGANIQPYQTLRDSLARAFTSFRDGAQSGTSNDSADMILALDRVTFEVRQGEVLGVIGHNGAGKSTLLRILSRITRPTYGEVRLRGRVGSLLEVGTGFHPELTGRENIFLNGAILGMGRSEIERKFDEIVDFAEIEQFLDTPVKRYSSGMYMRLAFSVAAHLEPEILLVDEVLAVGDAAFQKKCLGRMGQVAGEGRTVLFVSHNMGAIRSLCPRSILLSRGRLIADDPSERVVRDYLSKNGTDMERSGEVVWEDLEQAPGCADARLLAIRLMNPEGQVRDHFNVDDPLSIRFTYQVFNTIRGMRAIAVINTREGVMVLASTDHDQHPPETKPGVYQSQITVPGGLLNSIQYAVQIHLDVPGYRTLVPGEDFIYFTGVGNTAHGSHYPENWPGVVTPRCDWHTVQLE